MPETPQSDAPQQPAQAAPETPPVEEIDWKAEARKWEQRAKENKTAADRLAELEAANKSDLEKAQDAKTAAEQRAAQAEAEALRWKVAAKHGISEEDAELFLTGTDEETLTRQAQRLSERVADRRKNGNVVSKEGTASQAKEDPLREFARGLFQKADH